MARDGRQGEREGRGVEGYQAVPQQAKDQGSVEKREGEEREVDSPEQRASTSMEPGSQIAKSTEGQTIGGTEKTPEGKRDK